MTRINVVPVEELSDAWLLAEYRELPRVLKQPICLIGAPTRYQLGAGHVKWARRHGVFAYKRMELLVQELKYRGFAPIFSAAGLRKFLQPYMEDYTITTTDVSVNRARLLKKYRARPHVHTWTKRTKPGYLNS